MIVLALQTFVSRKGTISFDNVRTFFEKYRL